MTNTGNDDQSAEGTASVHVEVDGVNVPVTSGAGGDVVFCNWMYRRQTLNFDDEDATIRTFFETRAANAFNWVALIRRERRPCRRGHGRARSVGDAAGLRQGSRGEPRADRRTYQMANDASV